MLPKSKLQICFSNGLTVVLRAMFLCEPRVRSLYVVLSAYLGSQCNLPSKIHMKNMNAMCLYW